MSSTVDMGRALTLAPAERAELLTALAARVRAHERDLTEAALRVFPFPRRVIEADLRLAIDRLTGLGGRTAELTGRDPIGTVALALPGNAMLSNPVGTIGAAVLAGNRVIARIPARRRAWSTVLADLLRDIEPVALLSSGGREFVDHALRDPAVGVVMLFGDDTWATGYEPLVRATRTRFVFEGPGNDPFLLLDPAMVERAAAAAVESGFFNAGQACTAAERCYVLSDCYPEFVERVVAAAARMRVGDPADPDTEIGPLTPEAADRVERQIADAVDRGARAVRTGRPRRITIGGAAHVLVPPVVLTGVDHSMAVMRDETFGPVLAIQRVRSVGAALDAAEDNRYGLSATVFGGTETVHRRLARSHGQVFADETWLRYRHRNPLAPYGGRRRSGWVWDRRGEVFVRRDGPRHNVAEFSVPRTTS